MPKRKQLLHVEFDSLDDAHRLWFLALVYNDLRLARHAIHEALALAQKGHDDQSPDGLYSICHDAAVVRYARGFLRCKLPGGKGTTELPTRLTFGDSIPDSAFHAQIIGMRHTIVAHSDMGRKEVGLTKLKTPEEGGDWWRLLPGGAHLPPLAMRIFRTLCAAALQKVVAETRPLIEGQLSSMKVGDMVHLRDLTGIVERNENGEANFWLPAEEFSKPPR